MTTIGERFVGETPSSAGYTTSRAANRRRWPALTLAACTVLAVLVGRAASQQEVPPSPEVAVTRQVPDAPASPDAKADTSTPAAASNDAKQSPAPRRAEVPLEIDTSKLVRLSKTHPLWIDRDNKWVVLDGRVCLQRGTLEMFACPKGTKEHESVVSVDATPFEAHVALMAVGAKPGGPATFVPKYRPATGTEVDIWVLWKDADGKPQRAPARDWIRDVRTKKGLQHAWVFAGSSFWKDPKTGQNLYQADSGDFVCVSNFPTATLDLTVESSQSEGELLFEAFTERVPEVGTPVRLVLVPKPAAP